MGTAPSTGEPPKGGVYPTGLRFWLIMAAVYIAMFLVALDRLIISTATPAITQAFHSSNDIGWYGTAYLLTNCTFLLVFGKIYTIANIKATFMTAITLFEVGSALCGAAPNNVAFIIGRAIAGLGAGGVQGGIVVIIVYAVPLAKRPAFQGSLGGIYGIASIVGPLIGGAFTTNVTWRWAFYINLPIGGAVMIFIFFLLRIPEHEREKASLKDFPREINLEGAIILLGGIICLCIALQWGGFTYSWSNGRIIALLVLAAVLLIAFVGIQIWRKTKAMVPPHIFLQRSIASGFVVSCFVGGHMTVIIYYLPIWFEAVKGNSAVEAGIRLLPMVLSLVVGTILTGILTTVVGRYTPFLIFGICLSSIGAGLLTTLEVGTSEGKWIGYQIVYGFGLGSCFQAPSMAAQTLLPKNEVSIGASLMLFAQSLFGSIFVSVGQNVLDGGLSSRLARFVHITTAQIEQAGATGILGLLPPQDHTAGLVAYNASLRRVFLIALVLACCTIFGGLGMEWVSVKEYAKKEEERNGDKTTADIEAGRDSDVNEMSRSQAGVSEKATSDLNRSSTGGSAVERDRADVHTA